jgi:hypothetical protein
MLHPEDAASALTFRLAGVATGQSDRRKSRAARSGHHGDGALSELLPGRPLTISGAGPDLGGVSATVSDRACRKIGRSIPYRLRTHPDGAEALIANVPLVPVWARPEHDCPMRDHQGLSRAATHSERIRPRLRSRISRNSKSRQSRNPLPHSALPENVRAR